MNRRRFITLLLVVVAIAVAFALPAFAEDAGGEVHQSNVYATFWSLVPPLVAIVLALLTKEVYSSFFVGIVFGALLYANFDLLTAYTTMFTRSEERRVGNESSSRCAQYLDAR